MNIILGLVQGKEIHVPLTLWMAYSVSHWHTMKLALGLNCRSVADALSCIFTLCSVSLAFVDIHHWFSSS